MTQTAERLNITEIVRVLDRVDAIEEDKEEIKHEESPRIVHYGPGQRLLINDDYGLNAGHTASLIEMGDFGRSQDNRVTTVVDLRDGANNFPRNKPKPFDSE